MKPFTKTTGRVAVLDRHNVDTDQIVPKQFLKRIDRTGYDEGLFFDWRYEEDGKTPREDFELNHPQFQGASILITGRNFGCGSSREHAVWALQDYGFDVVIAPSFSDIFHSNAGKSGLLTVTLPEDEVKLLMEHVDLAVGSEIHVDLERLVVIDANGREIAFEHDATMRHRLLNGLDDISLTLQHEDEITAYEATHRIT